ncbi:MAG: BatA domain-containing protein [Pirellulales bacterium]|nr:BatA domain-containing protein [Pirellulales bacterium]
MNFTFPSLISVYLLPFLAVVLAIHLIHLLRHRRVRWAAMDFLLESKKKNQTSVRLKQLLLLLLRLAAIAMIIFLLAGPILQDAWSRLLGGTNVHHVILLDDSASMTDREEIASAFNRGQRVAGNIVDLAAGRDSQQAITLLTFSSAADESSPEILRKVASRRTAPQWKERISQQRATALGVGPLEALEGIERKIVPARDEKMILYVLSDFRAPQWQESAALRQQAERLSGNDIQLELIQCAKGPHQNLAITQLVAMPGPQVVDIAVRMRVVVTNYGKTPQRNVAVQLSQQTVTEEGRAAPESLGGVTLEKIDPGMSVEGFFDVIFQDPGSHLVHARINEDAVALDNHRWAVIDISQGAPVLVIDDGGEDASLFLRLALDPNPQVSTGAQVQVERSSFLRDAALDRYHAIFLLNIANLDEIEVERLDQYVRRGGGIVFFAGPQTDRDFVNRELYRDGEGFFPLPLASPATLLLDRAEASADIEVDAEHPVFSRIFGTSMNNWLQAIDVSRYYATEAGWSPEESPLVRVLAQLRDGAPWIVEKSWGEGKVLAVLSTAAPRWHNWGLADPSFVLWTLDTLVYLGSTKTQQDNRTAGEKLRVETPPAAFLPLVSFTAPATGADGQRETTQIAAIGEGPDSTVRVADFGRVDWPGVYEVRRNQLDGGVVLDCEAFHAPESESDLAIFGEGQMRGLLKQVPYNYRPADTFFLSSRNEAGFPLAEQWWVFLIIALLLVVEQWIAYGASYHPSVPKRREGER